MNKFLKSAFLMLAFVSMQSSKLFSVNWQGSVAEFTYGMMVGCSLEFAHSQIYNYTLSPASQKLVIANAVLTTGLLIPDLRYFQKKRERLQPQFAYQQQRLAIAEQDKKEDAKRKKELAILRGKNRIPHFFSDPFGGSVDRVAEMFAPNKRQLYARLDEVTSAKNKLLALNAYDQEIKDAQKRTCMLYAPIVIPYLVGGGVMAGRALALYFTSKK